MEEDERSEFLDRYFHLCRQIYERKVLDGTWDEDFKAELERLRTSRESN